MKKKLTCALLAAVMLFALAACGSSDEKESESPTPRNITGYTFDIPDGFTVSADNEELWLAPGYPTDGSNINVTATEYDKLFSTYTREVLEASLESLFAEALEQEIDVTSDSFGFTTIDGVEAIRYRYHFDLYGVTLRQEVVTVNAPNGGYSFTFTQSGDANWDDAYNAAISSIKFAFE